MAVGVVALTLEALRIYCKYTIQLVTIPIFFLDPIPQNHHNKHQTAVYIIALSSSFIVYLICNIFKTKEIIKRETREQFMR